VKVIHITNMYPTDSHSYGGVFVRNQIDSLGRHGLNIKLKCIGRPFGGYSRIFSFRTEINEADIIHCHFGHTGSLALFWKLLERKPLVVSYCGDDLMGGVTEEGSYHLKGRLLASLNSLLSRYVDCAVVKSRQLAEKVKTKRVELIPNGVDMDLFREMDKQKARKKIGLETDEERIFFFLGQKNEPVKNFSLFEKSLTYLNFKFKFFVLENISYKDVVYYMNAADVCVLTSLHEGSPNVIKEAMACNRPIVSVDVGDVRELLGPVEGCFVVRHDPKEIAGAIRKSLDFQKTTARSRLLDLDLDLDGTAKRIIKLYEDILKK